MGLTLRSRLDIQKKRIVNLKASSEFQVGGGESGWQKNYLSNTIDNIFIFDENYKPDSRSSVSPKQGKYTYSHRLTKPLQKTSSLNSWKLGIRRKFKSSQWNKSTLGLEK